MVLLLPTTKWRLTGMFLGTLVAIALVVYLQHDRSETQTRMHAEKEASDLASDLREAQLIAVVNASVQVYGASLRAESWTGRYVREKLKVCKKEVDCSTVHPEAPKGLKCTVSGICEGE